MVIIVCMIESSSPNLLVAIASVTTQIIPESAPMSGLAMSCFARYGMSSSPDIGWPRYMRKKKFMRTIEAPSLKRDSPFIWIVRISLAPADLRTPTMATGSVDACAQFNQ